MNYFSENDIRNIVAGVISGMDAGGQRMQMAETEVPVEVSARHVHLSRADADILFGPGCQLTQKRNLSQPGQYLCEERVKLVSSKGQIDAVAVLGPLRKHTQVELSLTDARILGAKAPVRLSGDLRGAGDVVIVGPAGVVEAKGTVIAAKAHVHMTPEDAAQYDVRDGEAVSVRLGGERSVTIHDVIVRVDRNFALAVHIDYDEANAAQVGGGSIKGYLQKSR